MWWNLLVIGYLSVKFELIQRKIILGEAELIRGALKEGEGSEKDAPVGLEESKMLYCELPVRPRGKELQLPAAPRSQV